MAEQDSLTLKYTVKATVAKYADGVTQEDIDSGKVQPYEVLTEEREATPEEVAELKRQGVI